MGRDLITGRTLDKYTIRQFLRQWDAQSWSCNYSGVGVGKNVCLMQQFSKQFMIKKSYGSNTIYFLEKNRDIYIFYFCFIYYLLFIFNPETESVYMPKRGYMVWMSIHMYMLINMGVLWKKWGHLIQIKKNVFEWP